MAYEYGGWMGTPGIQPARETYEDQIWREHFDFNAPFRRQCQISGAARDAGHAGQTTILRAGLLMGRVRGSNVVTTWNPAGTDGSQDLYGILLITTSTQEFGADRAKWNSFVLVGGLVRSASIIVPGNAAAGLGGPNGAYVRQTLSNAGRFRVDDGEHDWIGNGYRGIEVRSANFTPAYRDSGKLFGLDNDAQVTLPLVGNSKGVVYDFYGHAGAGGDVNSGNNEIKNSGGNTSTVVVANGTLHRFIGFNNAQWLHAQLGELPNP